MSMTGPTAAAAPASAPAPAPVSFDPAHPNFSALNWNPTYAEARAQLMTDRYGHRYDGVQMTTISLPVTWPRWATLVSAVVPSILALGGIGLFFTGTRVGTFFAQVVLVFAGILALIGIGIYAVIHFIGRMSAGGYEQVKLERLAADNGLTYRQRGVPPPYPGCIFTTGTFEPYVFDDFSTATPSPIDFGNYHPVSVRPDGPGATSAPPTGSSWGFLAIRLSRPLPGLLLVSKTRVDGDVTLPVHPNPRQVLSLEGNFDQYFTLYCQPEHARDALYVITPDLMALLIDQATPFDVEIVEDWMFFYSRIPFDLLDESVYRRLFTILGTIGGKVLRQASRDGERSATIASAPVSVPASTPVPVPVTASPSVVPDDPARHLANSSTWAASTRGRLLGRLLGVVLFAAMVAFLVYVTLGQLP